MSALGDLIGNIGGIGQAMGIQGDGPGNLNAMQRAGLSPQDSANYAKASALATLAQSPDFQQADPSTKMTALTKIIGDPVIAQKALATLSTPTMNTGNPQQFISQGVQTGNIAPADALTALANPNLQLGNLAQLNNSQPQSNQALPETASPPAQKTGINYDYLNKAKQISPAAGTMAENMISGVFNPESGKGENDPLYNAALTIARNVDPTFTPQSLIGRPQMVKNSTSGDMYKLETSLNTGMAHLYDLHEMAPLTMNEPGSSPPINWIGKEENIALGGSPNKNISRYSATLNTAAPEIAKYLGGGGATDTGTAEAKSNFSENQAPDSIQQNARDLGAKMMAKGGSLQNEYSNVMGYAGTHKVVQPLTTALYSDMQGVPLTLNQQQLVNEHRAESNLPSKTWGADKTASQPVPLNIPQPKPSASKTVDPAAIAEARRRGLIK